MSRAMEWLDRILGRIDYLRGTAFREPEEIQEAARAIGGILKSDVPAMEACLREVAEHLARQIEYYDMSLTEYGKGGWDQVESIREIMGRHARAATGGDGG